MATPLECLRQLPPDLVVRDLAGVRDQDATVAEHIARLTRDEVGYEVRGELRNYGRAARTVLGLIGSPAVYRPI